MSSAAFDTSSLYSTEHGAVEWTTEERFQVTLGGQGWALTAEEIQSLYEAVQPLAAQVYRCNCDCRWQLRLEGRSTIVLDTDEVLRLHSLLDGAAAMLELYSVLDDARIARSRTACR